MVLNAEGKLLVFGELNVWIAVARRENGGITNYRQTGSLASCRQTEGMATCPPTKCMAIMILQCIR